MKWNLHFLWIVRLGRSFLPALLRMCRMLRITIVFLAALSQSLGITMWVVSAIVAMTNFGIAFPRELLAPGLSKIATSA
jgi:hypothetical protein